MTTLSWISRGAAAIRGFLRDARGAAAPVIVLSLIPIVGALGMGAEASSWFLMQRRMQTAADSATMAAARNACTATDACHTTSKQPTYDSEAKAAASQMGFTDGGDVTVVATNTATCPDGTATCYQVTITRKMPFYLLKTVGFAGDTVTASGQTAQTVNGLAQAKLQPGTAYCITALGTASDAIAFKGANQLDLTGCDLGSNGGASCNAHTGDTIRYATVLNVGDGKNCGSEKLTTTAFTDNFSAKASNINSSNTECGATQNNTNFPQSPRTGNQKNNVSDAPTYKRNLSASADVSGKKCGDVKLANNVTVSSDQTMTIYNGRLDLNGFTLSTASGAHLTIVFSGVQQTSNNIAPDHIVMTSSGSGGAIDIAAPTSTTATWAGIAIYQDPAITNTRSGNNGNLVNYTVSGSSPQFNITGLVYAPNAIVDISGAINHATSGDACLAFVVKQLTINGTGSLFDYPTRACDRAGLTQLAKVNDKVVLVK